MTNDLIMIRNAQKEDIEFIFATWLRGLRYGNSWFEMIDRSVYFKVYHSVLESIIYKPNTLISVACLKEDSSVILGYSVSSGKRLDWLYVKKAWRNIGIAKMLTPESITTVSHLTAIGANILKKHPDVKFNPFDFN